MTAVLRFGIKGWAWVISNSSVMSRFLVSKLIPCESPNPREGQSVEKHSRCRTSCC
jgi:hypothetical protein